MRSENLRELIHAAPFRPFALCLANGSRIEIQHPEWILHPAGARTAIVMFPNESVRIVDVALVVEFQLGPPVPAGTVASEPNGEE